MMKKDETFKPIVGTIFYNNKWLLFTAIANFLTFIPLVLIFGFNLISIIQIFLLFYILGKYNERKFYLISEIEDILGHSNSLVKCKLRSGVIRYTTPDLAIIGSIVITRINSETLYDFLRNREFKLRAETFSLKTLMKVENCLDASEDDLRESAAR